MELTPVKSRSARRAVILVEAALALPLLLALTFLLLQYGWLFLKAEQISNAARHGARRAIVANITETEVKTGIADILKASGITAHQTAISDLAVAKGEIVTVTVTVPASQFDLMKISGIGGFAIPTPATLQSSVSMAKERS